MPKVKIYKAYHYPTAAEFYFCNKPTISDLRKVMDSEDFDKKEFDITKIEIIDN